MSKSFEQQRIEVHQQAVNLDSAVISTRDVVVASNVTDQMIDKFALDPSEVRTLPVRIFDGSVRAVVMHTGTGLDRGSWDEIQDDERLAEFALQLGNVAVDTRNGMCREVYQAMHAALYAESLVTGKPYLTDQLPPEDPRHAPRTWTWLTAYTATDSPSGGEAPIGIVRYAGQQVEFDTRHATVHYDMVRFQPAVIITKQLVEAAIER